MKIFAPEEIDQSLPEVVKNFLASGKKLEEIKLDARGKWTHEGLDFENPRIIKLFSKSIARTEGGTWVLDVPPFTYPIEVEDTPYFVEHITHTDDVITLSLSDDTEEQLDVKTLDYASGGRLYCEVKKGAFRARFKRQAYYNLVELAQVNDTGEIVLVWGEVQVPLSTLESEP